MITARAVGGATSGTSPSIGFGASSSRPLEKVLISSPSTWFTKRPKPSFGPSAPIVGARRALGEAGWQEALALRVSGPELQAGGAGSGLLRKRCVAVGP